MEAYLCFGEKRSLIAEVPFILSICKTKCFFTWCWLFLYWQSLENPMLLRALGCRLQGGLYSVSPFWLNHSSLQIHSPSSQAAAATGAFTYGYSSKLLPAAPRASLNSACFSFHCIILEMETDRTLPVYGERSLE